MADYELTQYLDIAKVVVVISGQNDEVAFHAFWGSSLELVLPGEETFRSGKVTRVVPDVLEDVGYCNEVEFFKKAFNLGKGAGGG